MIFESIHNIMGFDHLQKSSQHRLFIYFSHQIINNNIIFLNLIYMDEKNMLYKIEIKNTTNFSGKTNK